MSAPMQPGFDPAGFMHYSTTPGFWRRKRRFVWLFALIGALTLVLLSPASWWAWLGVSHWFRYLIWIPYPILLTWWIASYNAGDAGTWRRIADGQLPCWRCGYDLSSTDSPGICPECGLEFERVHLSARWGLLSGARQRRRKHRHAAPAEA